MTLESQKKRGRRAKSSFYQAIFAHPLEKVKISNI
jgi:hypothetical protein